MIQIEIAQTEKVYNDALNIRKKVFVEEQNISMQEEIDRFENEATHFVGYLHKKPVAASRLRYVDNYGKLERLCVLKKYRNRSFGKKMIQTMEREVYRQGFSKTILHAQLQTVSLYESLGYQIVSKPFLEAGIPHVKMKKN